MLMFVNLIAEERFDAFISLYAKTVCGSDTISELSSFAFGAKLDRNATDYA